MVVDKLTGLTSQDQWRTANDNVLHGAVSVWTGGSLLQIKAPSLGRSPKSHARAEIKVFSKASRRRLLRLGASIQWGADRSLPLFITLCYPAVWNPDWRSWKKDLDNFRRALDYRFGKSYGMIWRLEMQERGAPHFHLVLFGQKFIHYSWVAKTWNKIVGGDLDHLKAGTRVERLKNGRQGMFYISKYLGKQDQSIIEKGGCGRFWGVRRLWNIPRQEEIYILRKMEWIRFKARIVGYLKSQGVELRADVVGSPWYGLTTFINADVARQWMYEAIKAPF